MHISMLIELVERRNQICKKRELIKEQNSTRRIRWHPEQERLPSDRADIVTWREAERVKMQTSWEI